MFKIIYRLSFMFVLLISTKFSFSTNEEDSLVSVIAKYSGKEKIDQQEKLCVYYLNTGNYLKARDLASEMIALSESVGYAKGKALGLLRIGISYYLSGNYEKAIEYYLQAAKIYENEDDKIMLGRAYTNIGNVYVYLKNHVESMKYFQNSLKLKYAANDTTSIFIDYMNIGNEFVVMKNYDEAERYYKRSIASYNPNASRALNNYAYVVNNLGELYMYKSDYIQATVYFEKALALAEELGEKQMIGLILVNMGYVQTMQYQFPKALNSLNRAVAICAEIKSLDGLKECYNKLSIMYERMGNASQALVYYKLYTDYKDTVFNQNNIAQLNQLEAQYQSEKKEQAIALLTKDKTISELKISEQQANLSRQRNIILVSVIVIVLVLVLVWLLYNQNAYRKKMVASLTAARNEIVLKNQNITDSIHYAQRIQSTILPREKYLNELFPDHFVLFKPRDIVSGDFYWCTRINGKKIIALVDCTGHGVPGAFMSIIGNNLLDDIINKKQITAAAEILNKLNEGVFRELNQKNEKNDEANEDGMEVSLLVVDERSGFAEYAASNQQAFILRRNGNMEILKGDIHSIGGSMARDVKYSAQKLALNKGEIIYLTTDGLIDQMGGEQKKRFGTTAFKNLLTEVQSLPFVEQQKKIDDTIATWKGNLSQTDDMLMVAVRF